MELELVMSTNLKKELLYGCCFLPGGRCAIASNENKKECILVVREDSTVDFRIISKPFNVFDVAHIPPANTLAVTTGWGIDKCINLIDLNSRRITRSIPTDTRNFGITYKDEHLFYFAMDVGICKLNIDDETVTIFKSIPKMSAFSYIASFQDKLYYTNFNAHTVACCSMEGNTKWELKDEKLLCHPQGLCIDHDSNVYVLGSHADNLVVLSSDGSRHSELLSKKDGLQGPVAIDFDGVNNRLLITNVHFEIFLYKLQSHNL